MAEHGMTDQNTLSDQERGEGWRLLFDGANPGDHWRGFRQEEFPGGWEVVDGTLHRADKGGDIITREQYRDFELSLEWKVAGKGNSGIFFRVGENEGSVPRTGPEFQVLNNEQHPDGKTPETAAGANYALHAPTHDATRPIGQWNDTRIVVHGNHVEHWLNGDRIVEYELGSDDWKQRVANSKFNQFPQYGRLPEGHLALQDHGDPVWYRNIKVRRL